ncbi:hypothetical protein [Flavihumibacter fluvii]|uniref:hypothetical protein n=1 Tax=Flavihumibacter fluvii TaxID=2838157 RepID=UPI001BDDD12D|nr:hypothetical protein [Flavihumibacter fluvii]ULQ52571.1 hypothetical protein KJS93_21005 [Flavihumibacter fluvii]
MPDKNHNNPVDWRNRLEEPGQVPGLSPLNKIEAWEKLYERLEQPEKKNKNAWLWLAAVAILTGMLFTITWFYQEKNMKEQTIVQQQRGSQTLKTQDQAASREAQPKITQPAGGRPKQKDRENKAHQLTIYTSQPAAAPDEKDLSPVQSSALLIKEPDIVIKNSIDSPITALVPVAKTKKKMALVYLNEIEAGNSGLLTNQPGPKKQRPLYSKFGHPAGDEVYVASQPERFTITISSAN